MSLGQSLGQSHGKDHGTKRKEVDGCQSRLPSSPEVNVMTRDRTGHRLTGVLLTFQETKCPLKKAEVCLVQNIL